MESRRRRSLDSALFVRLCVVCSACFAFSVPPSNRDSLHPHPALVAPSLLSSLTLIVRPAMSQPHKQTAVDPAEGSIASRTRRRTRIRSRDDGGEEETHFAQSSTHVSPAMRIYRHALIDFCDVGTAGPDCSPRRESLMVSGDSKHEAHWRDD